MFGPPDQAYDVNPAPPAVKVTAVLGQKGPLTCNEKDIDVPLRPIQKRDHLGELHAFVGRGRESEPTEIFN